MLCIWVEDRTSHACTHMCTDITQTTDSRKFANLNKTVARWNFNNLQLITGSSCLVPKIRSLLDVFTTVICMSVLVASIPRRFGEAKILIIRI